MERFLEFLRGHEIAEIAEIADVRSAPYGRRTPWFGREPRGAPVPHRAADRLARRRQFQRPLSKPRRPPAPEQ